MSSPLYETWQLVAIVELSTLWTKGGDLLFKYIPIFEFRRHK